MCQQISQDFVSLLVPEATELQCGVKLDCANEVHTLLPEVKTKLCFSISNQIREWLMFSSPNLGVRYYRSWSLFFESIEK